MKQIVLIVSLFFVAMNGMAQGLEIGVYGEPQIIWFTSDEDRVINNGPALNLSTGIDFDLYFMENYAFTFGISVNNQGGKILYMDETEFMQEDVILTLPADSEAKHSLRYLGVPLGLKLKTEEMGYTTIYFHGGVLPLFNYKAVTSSDDPVIISENIKPEINIFSFNYFLELGVEYRLAGNTAIVAGFKYSSGFNDVTKNDFSNVNLNSAGLHLGLIF